MVEEDYKLCEVALQILGQTPNVSIAEQSSVNIAFQLTDCQTYSLFLAFILASDRSWDAKEEWYTSFVHQAREFSEVSKNTATRHDLFSCSFVLRLLSCRPNTKC